MKHFDFADIEQVNRIELKPGEMVVFRTEHPITDREAAAFREYFVGTPLEDRTVFMSGDWKIATIAVDDDAADA